MNGRRNVPPEVRLLGLRGDEIGLVPTTEAMRMAEEQGLELCLIDPGADPPVARLLSFDRFKFETRKQEKASRRAVRQVAMKHVRLTPTTDQEHLARKVEQLRGFLGQGHQCMVPVVLEGRERAHPETGQAMLEQVTRALGASAASGTVAQEKDGTMTMLIVPLERLIS